jgi:chromosome segregation protein
MQNRIKWIYFRSYENIMHLSRLELQGFKTFAKKTVLEFPQPKTHDHALTVIVGPNGSGKSNLSDAIRWCLGEQSMKHLRGKKSEDIIFSGSEGKGRSGFAEVSMTFDNSQKKLGVDYSEVTVTRRLYRDGESEYLLNGQTARLADIQLLLAEAGVGQRSYTVVGQGMIDHVLTSSPEERKIFFDDATGVRGLQIKRHQAMLKLEKASQNLVEVELLLSEIEPRLKSLRRQVHKLEQREAIEKDLHARRRNYYGTMWWDWQDELAKTEKEIAGVGVRVEQKRAELEAGQNELAKMEEAATGEQKDDGIKLAQDDYRRAQAALSDARHQLFAAERELELSKVKAQSTWAPLPLHEIINELGDLSTEQTSLLAELRAASDLETVNKLLDRVESIFIRSARLRTRLTKPNPEDFKADPKLIAAIDAAKTNIRATEESVKASEKQMDAITQASAQSKTAVFAVERRLRQTQQELYAIEQEENRIKIDLARVETRLDGLKNELREELGEMEAEILRERPAHRVHHPEDERAEILRLKHQLELIGGIDEETINEYKTTEERFTFLDGQLKDIRAAIASTEKIIDELDDKIRAQSEKAFEAINKEFQKYFKVLFGGGSCSLIKMKESELIEDRSQDQHVALDRAMEELAEERLDEDAQSTTAILKRVKERSDAVAGIDIQATPPGKTLKALNLLSGGERALTSIALLSAIMATNPSPFVVLDEVDAALDEANTVRFANILLELQKLTQFIVITHNRATMERADLLYGVTMGDDGISNLISVALSDIDETGATARR